MASGAGLGRGWDWGNCNYRSDPNFPDLWLEWRQIPEGTDKYETVAVLWRWGYGCFLLFKTSLTVLTLPLNSIIKSIKADLFNRETALKLSALNESRAPWHSTVCFFVFLIEEQLICNVVLISSVQQSTFIPFQLLFCYRSLQDIEYIQ